MKSSGHNLIVTFIVFWFSLSGSAQELSFTISNGGVIRGNQQLKKIALIFSADEYAEGLNFIDSTLVQEKAGASFFFTGNFFKNPANRKTTRLLLHHGNYVGTHSYGHLLYNSWERRDSLLISQTAFTDDLNKAFAQLKKYFHLTKKQASYFLPPYEWYNDTIAQWAKEYGLQVVNFTPGTYSNADYTTPDMGKKYLSSDTIFNRIVRFESQSRNGLNGFILLSHAGAGPQRTDKFFKKLPALIQLLKAKGYEFVRIDELLKGN